MHALLRNRDFMGLFGGRLVTNAGDSLYFVAAMWLVLDLTGNPAFSGLAGFLTMGPQALQAFAGPLVDRWNVRRLLVATQLLQAGLVLLIPAAQVAGVLSVWVVLTVLPLASLLNQLVYPAESAALPRLVDQQELVAANSAFSLAYQGVDMVFNAVGGAVLALAGAVSLFLVDSVTFVLAALLFASIHIPPAGASPEDGPGDEDESDSGAVPADGSEEGDDSGAGTATADGGGDEGEDEGYLASLREGVAFLRGTVVALLLGGSLVINAALGAVLAVLPAYAAATGGPGFYGLLMAAFAGGLLGGALVASALDGVPFGLLVGACFTASGAVWFAALAVSPPLATAGLLGLAFVPAGVTNVLINSLVQTLVPEELLGRVMAVIGSASAVSTPVGALLGGVAASAVGPAPVMAVAGGGFLFLAAYVLALPTLRRMPAMTAVETLARA